MIKYLWMSRKMKPHFKDDNINIDGWIFNAVHILPKILKINDEIDYYLDTGKSFYIVRFIFTEKNSVEQIINKPIDYIILNFSKFETEEKLLLLAKEKIEDEIQSRR